MYRPITLPETFQSQRHKVPIQTLSLTKKAPHLHTYKHMHTNPEPHLSPLPLLPLPAFMPIHTKPHICMHAYPRAHPHTNPHIDIHRHTTLTDAPACSLTVSGSDALLPFLFILRVDVLGLRDPVQVATQVLLQLLLLSQFLEVSPRLGFLSLLGKLSGT